MEYTQDQVYELLLRKKKGHTGGADDAYIKRLLEDHEDVSLLWEDIRCNDFREEVWYDMNATAAWEEVQYRISDPFVAEERGAFRKWLIAACIAGVAAAGAWFLLRPSIPADNSLPAETVKGLRLELANGRAIPLPHDRSAGNIKAGATSLTVNANTLQYKASEAGGNGFNTLIVPPGMDYRVVLSDGTEVWLNATSSLHFPFSFDQRREVYLEGEGYFKVAKHATQPFIVHTPKTDIEVLGTEFNINTYQEASTSLSLVAGAVAAKAKGARVVLKPGQEAVFTEEKGFTVQPFDPIDVKAWMSGTFIFEKTPLKNIAPVIKRWFGVEVVFDDAATANVPFTGMISKNKDLRTFLENLKAIGVDYYYQQDTPHLKYSLD
jgi:transmembrane sensor